MKYKCEVKLITIHKYNDAFSSGHSVLTDNKILLKLPKVRYRMK